MLVAAGPPGTADHCSRPEFTAGTGPWPLAGKTGISQTQPRSPGYSEQQITAADRRYRPHSHVASGHRPGGPESVAHSRSHRVTSARQITAADQSSPPAQARSHRPQPPGHFSTADHCSRPEFTAGPGTQPSAGRTGISHTQPRSPGYSEQPITAADRRHSHAAFGRGNRSQSPIPAVTGLPQHGRSLQPTRVHRGHRHAAIGRGNRNQSHAAAVTGSRRKANRCSRSDAAAGTGQRRPARRVRVDWRHPATVIGIRSRRMTDITRKTRRCRQRRPAGGTRTGR